MSMPALKQFNLVGGTSLSLQIGHRISIDLDLFSNQDFNNSTIIQALEPLGELTVLVDNPPFLQARLNDVKLDFLKYPYPFVVKSLTYFDDAERELNPEMLINVSWQMVKKTIEKKVEHYLKSVN